MNDLGLVEWLHKLPTQHDTLSIRYLILVLPLYSWQFGSQRLSTSILLPTIPVSLFFIHYYNQFYFKLNNLKPKTYQTISITRHTLYILTVWLEIVWKTAIVRWRLIFASCISCVAIICTTITLKWLPSVHICCVVFVKLCFA
jgi:hypothetical protein